MKQKVLLMGRSGSGKTSMRSIIFANYVAQDTSRLGATMEVEHSNVRFLGDLVLNLWDCGGQENFMNNYFESQRGHIFRGVKVLIYVFDLDSNDHRQEVKYFKDCIQALSENSADAQIFALLHKMDLVPEGKQASTRDEYEKEVRTIANPFSVECFATSIWDETLYRAWSTIVHQLIPNSQRIETMLEQFRSVCEAEEVVLFESATFLVISQAASTSHPDVHRFEKISNIVKQFKLSCAKSQAQCDEMVVRNASFTAFVHRFTSNTYVMVVTTDKAILPTATAVNIGIAKAHFEKTLSATGATAESSA